MTEEIRDDDYLVRVKAQVMTRDDSTSCWVPMGGGGMSIVGLRKLVVQHAEDIRHEYLIHGHRIADQSVVLNCVLKKDVQYTKANPTFHHWRVEEKRFGLTFQSSADARAFDKAVKRAVEDLLEGSPDSNANDIEVGDDEVFMAVDLPLGRKDSTSQSASTASTTTSSPTPQSPAFPGSMELLGPFSSPGVNHPHLHRVHYITRQPRPSPQTSDRASPKSKSSSESTGRDDVWVKAPDKNGSQKIKMESSAIDTNVEMAGDYSYVQFRTRSSIHDYSYPTIDSISSKTPERRESVNSVKKHNLDIGSQPKLPTKTKKKRRSPSDARTKGQGDKKVNCKLLGPSQRSWCVYCHEMFIHDENHRGICEDAPDKMVDVIERVSCICCARAVLYHCMADDTGDYGHPCVCDTAEENHCKKWTALTILSLLVPCLWCYLPLSACHRWGKSCGCCGGRHKAA